MAGESQQQPVQREFESFDLPWALSRLDHDSTLLAELAALFLEESRALLSSIRVAVQQRDARAIETHAHALKGSVSNFGAKEVHRDALALETQGRARHLEQVDELLASLQQSSERLESELLCYIVIVRSNPAL